VGKITIKRWDILDIIESITNKYFPPHATPPPNPEL
jgi:hypothetical protein